jgi:hypothetical protein
MPARAIASTIAALKVMIMMVESSVLPVLLVERNPKLEDSRRGEPVGLICCEVPFVRNVCLK